MTCEPVIMHSFPYFSQEAVDSIAMAASVPDTKESTTAVLNAVMQAVIRFCPLMTIRDIYRKMCIRDRCSTLQTRPNHFPNPFSDSFP